jgi:hypothetical protein
MKNFEAGSRENDEVTEGFISSEMGLVPADGSGKLYALDHRPTAVGERTREKGPIAPEDLFRHFPEAQRLEPEPLLRPAGDTTLFTTAGVQRIESLLREEGRLERQVFAVAQPVVRSQYMDKVRDGVSTSFVNFSVESVRATPSEFVSMCDRAVGMMVTLGLRPEDARFGVDRVPDRWGQRKFTKTVLTFFAGETEVGEGVFMHDYPVTDGERIAVADVCFGVERLGWALSGETGFFPGFDEFYGKAADSNRMTSVIDCIRTSTLMAGEGVTPAHRDPGYRVRQLSKRFVERNEGVGADAGALVRASDAYWREWGQQPKLDSEEVTRILGQENERSWNVLLLSRLEKLAGKRFAIEVNQPTESFLAQAGRSLPTGLAEELKKLMNPKP